MILLPLEKELYGSEKFDSWGKLSFLVVVSIGQSQLIQTTVRETRAVDKSDKFKASSSRVSSLVINTDSEFGAPMDYCLSRLVLTTQRANTFT